MTDVKDIRDYYEEFWEIEKLAMQGMVYSLCEICYKTYQKKLGFIYFDICHKCMGLKNEK